MLDYETDEKGGFPKELKRGILSQNAIYDFFCEAEPSEEAESSEEARLSAKSR